MSFSLFVNWEKVDQRIEWNFQDLMEGSQRIFDIEEVGQQNYKEIEAIKRHLRDVKRNTGRDAEKEIRSIQEALATLYDNQKQLDIRLAAIENDRKKYPVQGQVIENDREENLLQSQVIENQIKNCVKAETEGLERKLTENILRKMPERMTSAELSRAVREEIRKVNGSAPVIDENAMINNVFHQVLTVVRNEVLASVRNEVQASMPRFAEKIGLLDERRHSEDQALIQRIQADFQAEKEKNHQLLERIKHGEDKIKKLSERIEEISSGKKPQPDKEKVSPGENEEIQPDGEGQSNGRIEVSPLFSSEIGNYKQMIPKIIAETEEVRKTILSIMGEADLETPYLKLVDKCQKKLSLLYSKMEEKEYTADKAASELGKIWKQTIAKALAKQDIRESLEQYFNKCGARKLDWKVGRLLSNEDYEYLEEPILYDKVDEPSKNGRITEIQQDTYVIDYEEDGEKDMVVIPGIYHIGKYSR